MKKGFKNFIYDERAKMALMVIIGSNIILQITAVSLNFDPVTHYPYKKVIKYDMNYNKSIFFGNTVFQNCILSCYMNLTFDIINIGR